jgi:hypothetical protein
LLIAIFVFFLGSFVGYTARGLEWSHPYKRRSYPARSLQPLSGEHAHATTWAFLVAICLGVAGTLAWQSYGNATKQMIANSIQWPSWTKQPSGPETTAAESLAAKTP